MFAARRWCLLLVCGLSFYTVSALALSPASYKQLNQIQVLIDDQQWEEAEARLHHLQRNLAPSFALALCHQLFAQYYLARDENQLAIHQYQRALSLQVLDADQDLSWANVLAKLYLGENEPLLTVKVLEKRLQTVLSIQGQSINPRVTYPMATLAAGYYGSENYRQAVHWIQQAINYHQDQVPLSWLQLTVSAYYQLGEYQAAAQAMTPILQRDTKQQAYWYQQAALYQMAGDYMQALTSLEIAYAGGYLKQDDYVQVLTQLLLRHQLPERAGRIMQARAKNTVDGAAMTKQQGLLLADVWQQARERKRAAQVLRGVANTETEQAAVFYYRAAKLALLDGDYASALVDVQQALQKGVEATKKGEALLLAGQCAWELENALQARQYFQRALQHADTASSAKQWLDYIEQY